MGKIVAIGGGEMRAQDTLAIDQRIIALTGKQQPRALFIPTASSDSVDYAEGFRAIYGDLLGCAVDTLCLLRDKPSQGRIAEQIQAADLIYVGGGNTLMMMRLWRRLGVDQLLREAYRRGTVLSGLSAGALCWFAYGHSDSRRFYNPEDWDYIRVRCLGWLNLTACPHLDGEKRLENFTRLMQKHGGMGLGIDDCAALEVIDDQCRVIASREGARAYRVFRQNGQMNIQPIEPDTQYQPLTKLTAKH